MRSLRRWRLCWSSRWRGAGSSGSPLASGDLIRSCAMKTAGRAIVAAGWTRDWLGRDCIRHTRPQAAMPAHLREGPPPSAEPPPPRRERLLTAADRVLLAPGAAAKNFTTTYVNAILGRRHEASDRAQIAIFEWSPGRTGPVRFTHGGGTAPRHPRCPASEPGN